MRISSGVAAVKNQQYAPRPLLAEYITSSAIIKSPFDERGYRLLGQSVIHQINTWIKVVGLHKIHPLSTDWRINSALFVCPLIAYLAIHGYFAYSCVIVNHQVFKCLDAVLKRPTLLRRVELFKYGRLIRPLGTCFEYVTTPASSLP